MVNIRFTVADYLLTRLRQLNVTEVFQIPGDYVKHFTQTLENFKGVTAIGCANELDASYAADAYGRTRGLGAVSLQYGVSTFSALNAVAGAYVERSPMVVISATPSAQDRVITKEYDVLFHHSTGNLKADREVYEHVTVAAETLSTAVGAAKKIDDLLIAAITHQRPVYIACYEEVWGKKCRRPSKKILKPKQFKSNKLKLKNAVNEAWEKIKAAKDPMIFAGVEVLRHGLSGLLQDLIKESGFLYTTTSLGKTVLDEKGEKFIGTYSDVASIPQVLDLVKKSDCFINLGTIITDDYLWFIENKYDQMILATTEQMRVGCGKYDEITMKDFMEALLKKFKSSRQYPIAAKAPAQPNYPEPWVSNSDPKFDKNKNTLTFNRFFQHTMKFLTDNKMLKDIVMTYGVSSSLYVATNAFGLKQNSFISSAAWQCIGFETGTACGAQLGSRKQAWTVAGDGGFMMMCQSLSTLARYNVNAVIFVMNNGVYAIEQVFVDVNSFKAGPKYKFDTFDILPAWDYMALAKAFGANGYRVKNVNDLNKTLKAIKNHPKKSKYKPTLVEIQIPEKDLAGQMGRLATG